MPLDLSKFEFPAAPSTSISVRVIQAWLGHARTERVTIAVAGVTPEGKPVGCLALTPTSSKHFPKEVGTSLIGFARLALADFEEYVLNGHEAQCWESPFTAIEALPPEIIEGDTSDEALRNALSWHSVFFTRLDASTKIEEDLPAVPRSNSEARFLAQVKAIAIQQNPNLIDGFRKQFSLSKTQAGRTEIDFCGSHYLTCYTAINPKSRRAFRGAEAALWRIARARDLFGFAGPDLHELTAWVPPEGLPVYSDDDYTKVREEILELEYQAKKEQILVRSVHAADDAAKHLLKAEAGLTSFS